jgi:hypothetical protein
MDVARSMRGATRNRNRSDVYSHFIIKGFDRGRKDDIISRASTRALRCLGSTGEDSRLSAEAAAGFPFDVESAIRDGNFER